MARRERNRRWTVALGVVVIAVTAAVASTEAAASERQTAVSGPPAPLARDGVRVETAPPRGVRPQGREAEQLLADARRLSPTVRRLLAELQASDVLVFLEVLPGPRCSDPPRWQLLVPSVLALVAAGAGARHLKIEVYGYHGTDRISWLAHELQHAVEIASAPEVTDDAALNRLYHRIGYRSGAHSWETTAAIDIGNQVLAELASARSALPVNRAPR
jgi:hypothetical protein